MIAHGGGDAQATSAAGIRHDVGQVREFIEAEVLPLVEKNYDVKLTKDPEAAPAWQQLGRGGGLHHGVVSPEWYHRVISYSARS